MRYNSFEVNYLISLISSTLNKRIPQNPVRYMDWRELFYLAEYHDISNIAYYALIGLFGQVPEIWRTRFAKIFRKWVTVNRIQEKEILLLKAALEDEAIDYMFLKDWEMKRYYPQPDMRAVEEIRILIRLSDERTVKHLMRKLGYHHVTEEQEYTRVYYKSARFQIIFYLKLFADNRKISPYFAKVWKKASPAAGYGHRYALGVDDFYIYMMSDICNAYAKGEAEARHILDIHLYLKKNQEQMNRTYIDTELGRLELIKMVKRLEDVGALWLGVYEGDETRQCRDIEEYVWSKGSYGRESSSELLPMIRDMEIWQIIENRKQRINKIIRWFFPKSELMAGRYPVLARAGVLLPLFWLFRLLSMVGFLIKIRYRCIYRFVMLKTHSVMSRNKRSAPSPAALPPEVSIPEPSVTEESPESESQSQKEL